MAAEAGYSEGHPGSTGVCGTPAIPGAAEPRPSGTHVGQGGVLLSPETDDARGARRRAAAPVAATAATGESPGAIPSKATPGLLVGACMPSLTGLPCSVSARTTRRVNGAVDG